MGNDLEFLVKWKPDGKCHFQENQGNIKYCNKDKCECQQQSTYPIPYVANGQVGGRKYECKNK